MTAQRPESERSIRAEVMRTVVPAASRRQSQEAATGSFGMICLRRRPILPAGNAERPAVELHDIANPQLPSTPGLRLAVHQDLAGRNQFLGV
jgi:hypothetical protein